MEEELCLVDSATTNSILRELKYFQTLKKMNGDILTIAGRDTVIVGTGRAIFTLPNGTQVIIEDALLYPDSSRTLISYRDIRKNGFHIETHEDNKEEYLLFTKDYGYGKQVLEKIPSLSSELYYTYIKPVEHVVYKVIFQNVDAFQTWHDRLGHPGIGMMRKITSNSIGHNLHESKISSVIRFCVHVMCHGKAYSEAFTPQDTS
jgi:peptide/histidine transporter 3/4